VAALTCLALAYGGAPRAFAQSSRSTTIIEGVVLDPAGAPAKGFKVVFRDVASNTRFTSTAADATGKYVVEVPLGGRYQIDNVIAADGVTKLPVEDAPMISVLTTDKMKLDVRFSGGHAPGVKEAAAGGPAKKPWYKQPGPYIGMAVVVVGVAAFAAGNGSSGGGEASAFEAASTDR
jgi:hypothetical protein